MSAAQPPTFLGEQTSPPTFLDEQTPTFLDEQTPTFLDEQTPTPTFFLSRGPNAIDPCIDMQGFLNYKSKRMEEMGDDSFFPLDRKTWMRTLQEQEKFLREYFEKHSKMIHLQQVRSLFYLNKIFSFNYSRSSCSYLKTRRSCDGFVDRNGHQHSDYCTDYHCCRGLIVTPVIVCERYYRSGNYIKLEINFVIENFSRNPADFKRQIEEYKSYSKILFVKINDDGIIVDDSLKLMLSYLDQSDDLRRSSAEPKIGETRIFVQYDISLPDGTSKECSLDVIRVKHGSSFPDIHDVELIIPSLE